MDENPKSIWKKSWSGPKVYFLVAAAAVAVVMALGLAFGLMSEAALLALVALGLTVFISLILLAYSFAGWVRRPNNFKRVCFVVSFVATLIALFYAEENWRGQHALQKFKSEWEAKGEKFDFTDFVPPEVPAEKNFAFSPVFIAEIKWNFLSQPDRASKWYGDRIFSETISNLLPQAPINVSGLTGMNWSYSHIPEPELPTCNHRTNLVDLSLWQNYYRALATANPAAGIAIPPKPQTPAADVLLALGKYNSAIEILRTASRLEFSRFPISYDDADPAGILLPHLASVRRQVQVLHLRAIAEMESGSQPTALDDLKLMLRLIDSVKTEPILISQRVRAVSAADVIQVVGQGLDEKRWSAEQLAELESVLADLDFLAPLQWSLKAEMGFMTRESDYLRRYRDPTQILKGMTWTTPPDYQFELFVNHFAPGGWFDQSALRDCRIYAGGYIPAIDSKSRVVAVELVKQSDRLYGAETGMWDPMQLIKNIFWEKQTIGTSLEEVVAIQASLDQARTAIALERCRLARGEFPESLDALAPQFIEKLPYDVIGGGPLKYRRTSDGQFMLYSIGWNGTDDGGTTVLKHGSSPSLDLSQGDWVWRYPGK